MGNDENCNECKVTKALFVLLNCPDCGGSGLTLHEPIRHIGISNPKGHKHRHCQCIAVAKMILNDNDNNNNKE